MNRLLKTLIFMLMSISLLAYNEYAVLFAFCNSMGAQHSGSTEIPADSINYPPILVDSFNLPILSPASGVQFFKEGILFLSSSKLKKKMLPEHLAFGSMEGYYAVLEDTAIGEPQLFSPDFYFSCPGEAVSFSRDYSSMYFTKYSEGLHKIHQAIYTITYRRSGWLQSLTPLAFCEGNFNYAHPALSHEGKFMIFSSDQSPSSGGMDLFITYLQGESWTDPKALPEEINTQGDELFPYVDKENNLYFSSNGLPGNGGYDIYVSRFNGESWEKPVNLPKPVNSANDELAFRMNFEGNLAFFSSGETGQNVNRQLYRLAYLDDDFYLDKLFLTDGLLKESQSLENLPFAAIARQEPETPPQLAQAEEKKKSEAKPKPVKTEQKTRQSTNQPAEVTLADKKKTNRKEQKTKSTRVKKPKETTVPPTTTPTTQTTVTTPTFEALETSDTLHQAQRNASETSETLLIPETSETSETSETILYRVQFASSTKSKGSYTVTVSGKEYTTWEYYYKGAYRITMGEFTSLKEATSLQYQCRKSGYPQAFVAAFKNEERSLDPELFR